MLTKNTRVVAGMNSFFKPKIKLIFKYNLVYSFTHTFVISYLTYLHLNLYLSFLIL